MNGQRRTHTHTHTHTHTRWNITQPQENKEIMLFVATWTDLEIIMLTKVTEDREKTNITLYDLLVES